MATCKECEFKDKRIELLKEQLRLETESADRWRQDYIMLFKSTRDLVDHDAMQPLHPPTEPDGGV